MFGFATGRYLYCSQCLSQTHYERISLSRYVECNVYIRVSTLNVSSTDEYIIGQLLSPSLLRFWRTGADRHQLSIDDHDDIEVCVLLLLAHYYWFSRLAVINMD